MSALHDLAHEAGLLADWVDAAGRKQRVSDGSLRAILEALGLPAGNSGQISESRALLKEDAAKGAGRLVTADPGEPVDIPGVGAMIFDEPGYHEVEGVTIAVAPSRAWSAGDAAPGRRIWGPAVQIPSLRDERGEPFGDFGALARFARAAAAKGADMLAMSPVHALFPADPDRFSPYGPSSRLFLNAFLADPSLLGDEGSGVPSGDLIGWEEAIPERMTRLRRLFDHRSEETRRAILSFAADGGEQLERHARYDALYARFGTGWQGWPEACRDAHARTVADFAARNREEVDFYLFLQWLADRSLERAQAAARESGMAIGLIADMAVGMDAGGSQAWSRPASLLQDLSVGAPPDPLGPDGQDWGITTFSPRALRRHGFDSFIDTIRAAMRHSGGIRIDHAMSLRRLWVIPHGAPATEGAYLRYPEQDLMRLLTLESWRAKAIVVGEDLGTVPDGFRDEMAKRGLPGMRVLWFERNKKGGFRRPEDWDRRAAAMTSTHDLPTVAGWWSGRDIDWTWKIGRTSAFESEAEEREARAKDRSQFWRAAGKGPQPEPANPGPAVDAAVRFAGSTPCDLALIPAEDLTGVTEQPNLPGTIGEHPNWRRRLPGKAETMLDAPEVAARIEGLNEARRT